MTVPADRERRDLGDQDPFGAVRQVLQVQGRDAEDLGHGDGGEDEVGPAQTEADGADDQAGRHGNRDAGPDAVPGSDVPVLQQDHRGVGAHAEVGSMAHGVLARVSAQDVPGRSRDDADEDQDHDVEGVGARHELRQQEEQYDARQRRTGPVEC